MNILWITNIPIPEASFLMNEKPIPFGGWLVGASEALVRQNKVSLSIAFPKNGVSKVDVIKGKKIDYYTFSPVKYKDINSKECNEQFEYILTSVKPDVVHIFGTEFPHTLSMVNMCNKMSISVVISIQGLVSVIAKHYTAYLPEKVQNKFTFRDFIKQDNLKQQQKKFEMRGKFEIEAIQKVKHVIGRTTWDKACSTQINPNVKYHFCNEILREEFYKHIWSINDCEKYSIFVSQAAYPIKGLHLVLESMPIILKKFPKAKLYVAGTDITKTNTLKDKLKISSYAKYIKKLIRKNNLQDKVIFTGTLDEKQMCQRFLRSHVFVSPSTIENESNSLSEAKILGVPCLASFVGGVSDRVEHGVDGFHYQHDAPYMLAHYVCEIFENEDLALKFSKKAREYALKTNDRDENTRRLIQIYEEILGVYKYSKEVEYE